MIPDHLPQTEWLARPAVQAIFEVLDGRDGKTRAVGGIVRDTLMGRLSPEADIDMATELLPVVVMQRAKARLLTSRASSLPAPRLRKMGWVASGPSR